MKLQKEEIEFKIIQKELNKFLSIFKSLPNSKDKTIRFSIKGQLYKVILCPGN